MVGIGFLALDLVPLALVTFVVLQEGPAVVPVMVVGGLAGLALYLYRKRHRPGGGLAAAEAALRDPPAARPLRAELVRAYSPARVAAATTPYFVALAAYGLLCLPWPPVRHWGGYPPAAVLSAVAAGGLALAADWLQAAYALGRDHASGRSGQR